MNLIKIIFLVPIIVLGIAAAIHATAYLRPHVTNHQPPTASHHLPRFWFFFLATIAAMVGVVLAPGMLTFLLAWEAMGLASAGLVAFENTEKSVRKATWIYLLACHAGACALMLAGVLLSSATSCQLPTANYQLPATSCQLPTANYQLPATNFYYYLAAFFCAIVGFGLKIGFPPFHVWLPEAHPAAPAPASAIMSGAMIPLGFYGLLNFFPANGLLPTTNFSSIAGWTLLALGAVGALGGILFALPQTNLKKLLAFSSVENMGVIAMGFGLSFLGESVCDQPIKIAAGLGALAHVLNHAFLKGALFLGAGSVLRQTGTLDQDKLGGLMKRMPETGTLFVLNALGLSGLPPFNGFMSELLIYTAAFYAVKSHQPALMAAGFLVLVALSLTGGLAAAVYCKAIGATFLGEPRSEAAAQAVETPARMWRAQAILFACSVAMIIVMAVILPVLDETFAILAVAGTCGLALVLLTAALVALRRFACPLGNVKPSCPTWDCGYHAPTARMAYTATAFTQPLVDLFAAVLKPRHHLIPFKGHPATPTDAAFVTETDDRALAGFWRPVFTWFARIFQRAHLLQNGSLHLYILLVILAVLILLATSFI